MANSEKQIMPPYAPYKSFQRLINGLRENGMPSHITRSLLPGSNSGKATMAATLKSLGLVGGADAPTPKLKQLLESGDNYKPILKEILEQTYPFLTDGSLDLKTTTTEKVTDKFKEAGATGSTVLKCMAFFLAACKDAQIPISPYVKAPAAPKSSSSPKPKKKGGEVDSEVDDDDERDDEIADLSGMMRITVPLHGLKDGVILFPEGMNKKQWSRALKVAVFILNNYRDDLEDDDDGGTE